MKTMCWLILSIGLAACGDNGGGAGGSGGGGSGGGGTSGCVAPLGVAYEDVCLPASPQMELARTACNNPYGIREACAADGSTTPSLGCLPNQPDPNAPPTPTTTTLVGFVKVFSGGPSSDAITVQLFRRADLTSPSSLSSAAPIGVFTTNVQSDVTAGIARACPMPEQGTQPNPCVVPSTSCSPPCSASDYCDGTTDPANPTCLPRKRWEARYHIENVPTNTELAIRTSGAGSVSDPTWAPLVQLRIIAATGDGMCADATSDVCWKDAQKSTYEASVSVLSRQDYVSIPTSVGLSAGITPGLGAIAGEVRDCQNVRLQYAAVGFSNPGPERFAFFNSNPFMTLPAAGRTSTDALGLFSGMNVHPGAMRVRAQGLSGGQPTDLGGADALVFPDTVTIVGINAGRPIAQPPAP